MEGISKFKRFFQVKKSMSRRAETQPDKKLVNTLLRRQKFIFAF